MAATLFCICQSYYQSIKEKKCKYAANLLRHKYIKYHKKNYISAAWKTNELNEIDRQHLFSHQ